MSVHVKSLSGAVLMVPVGASATLLDLQLALESVHGVPVLSQRLWLAGEALHHDPAGTNPALVDAHRLPERALPAGDHQVLIALATNHGKAWGVWLRAERIDQRRRQEPLPPLPVWR